MKKSILALSVLGLATICLADDDGQTFGIKKPFPHQNSGGRGGSTTPQIVYHSGGNVLGTNGVTVPVYVIYYGNKFPSTTPPIINAFVGGLSSAVSVVPNQTTTISPFAVNSSYCEAPITNCSSPGPGSTSVSGSLNYVASVNLAPSIGKSVNSGAISQILQTALTSGGLTVDDTAIYVLVTDPTIKVTGFPNSFCAYHTHSTSIIKGHNIHYAVAPEPATMGTCDGNFANGQMVTPNGDAGADEITDSLMHEFSETVTDPDITAWYTSNGEEDGDLCNYNYGPWSSLPTTGGATFNIMIGGAPYLVQWIWLNTTTPQYCSPGLPAPPPTH